MLRLSSMEVNLMYHPPLTATTSPKHACRPEWDLTAGSVGWPPPHQFSEGKRALLDWAARRRGSDEVRVKSFHDSGEDSKNFIPHANLAKWPQLHDHASQIIPRKMPGSGKKCPAEEGLKWAGATPLFRLPAAQKVWGRSRPCSAQAALARSSRPRATRVHMC